MGVYPPDTHQYQKLGTTLNWVSLHNGGNLHHGTIFSIVLLQVSSMGDGLVPDPPQVPKIKIIKYLKLGLQLQVWYNLKFKIPSM